MPRTKGSKTVPKLPIPTTHFKSQRSRNPLPPLTIEIASIQKAIKEQKNTLKEKKTVLKKAEKKWQRWKRRRQRQMLKQLKKQKKAEAERVVKRLLASSMSADEILEKPK